MHGIRILKREQGLISATKSKETITNVHDYISYYIHKRYY